MLRLPGLSFQLHLCPGLLLSSSPSSPTSSFPCWLHWSHWTRRETSTKRDKTTSDQSRTWEPLVLTTYMCIRGTHTCNDSTNRMATYTCTEAGASSRWKTPSLPTVWRRDSARSTYLGFLRALSSSYSVLCWDRGRHLLNTVILTAVSDKERRLISYGSAQSLATYMSTRCETSKSRTV